MKRSLLIAFTVLIAIVPTFAQQGQHRGNGKGQGQGRGQGCDTKTELRSEMRTWFEATVLPSLQTWHKEYDASLSADDLSKLNELRAQAKQLRSATHQSMIALRDKDMDRSERKEQAKALRERTHDEMMKIMESVKPIAKRSRDKMLEIFDRNEDKIDAWREEARKKMQTYCDDNDIEPMNGKMGGMGYGGGMGMFEGGRKAAMKFILWDGTSLPDAEMFGRQQGRASGPMMGSVTVAPNPTGTSASVNMKNLTNGPATIEVFDMNGARKAAHQVTVSGGVLDTTIPTSDLTPGTYMVSVSTAAGRKTTTLIVNR